MIERAAQGADRLPALVARGRRVREVLKRADHGVVATDAGRTFAEHAARSLRAVEEAADSVGELTRRSEAALSQSVSSASRRRGEWTSSP